MSIARNYHNGQAMAIDQSNDPVRREVPLSLTTATDGTQWVSFPATSCNALDVINDTGTKLQVRYSRWPDVSIPLYDGMADTYTPTNTSEISVRRADGKGDPVTVVARARLW